MYQCAMTISDAPLEVNQRASCAQPLPPLCPLEKRIKHKRLQQTLECAAPAPKHTQAVLRAAAERALRPRRPQRRHHDGREAERHELGHLQIGMCNRLL